MQHDPKTLHTNVWTLNKTPTPWCFVGRSLAPTTVFVACLEWTQQPNLIPWTLNFAATADQTSLCSSWPLYRKINIFHMFICSYIHMFMNIFHEQFLRYDRTLVVTVTFFSCPILRPVTLWRHHSHSWTLSCNGINPSPSPESKSLSVTVWQK